MKVYKGSNLPRLNNPAVSIGVFDGVHRGHSAVFSRVCHRARELEGNSVIVTFWPHPRTVLGKGHTLFKYLTTLEEKIALIEKSGIDHLIVINFTKEFAKIPSRFFIKDFLVEQIGIKHLVLGHDHHFGYKRKGNFENLQSCARHYKFGLEQLEAINYSDSGVSSTLIRKLIGKGDVRFAAQLLSYNYTIEGKITGGKKIGRVIGFPTANIVVAEMYKLIPADGVYAVRVVIGQRIHMGVMNIGHRPTIESSSGDKSLEVHIIDFKGNLYGRNIKVLFTDRIRNEIKFGSVDELRNQLIIDKKIAVRILSGH